MNIQFVLVGTGSPGNLGSAARAMWTMGFDELVLVHPRANPQAKEAASLAVEACFVLEKAKIYKTLEEALVDSHWVIGTTRRKRRYEKEFVSARQFAEWSQTLPGKERVSILFGTEDSGLSNREISLCKKLVVIPANPKFASLNLAQAVQIVAYELFQTKKCAQEIPVKNPPATTAEVHGMYEHLQQTLQEIGFLNQARPDHAMEILKTALGRAHLTKQETQLVRGVCRQIKWYGENKK